MPITVNYSPVAATGLAAQFTGQQQGQALALQDAQGLQQLGQRERMFNREMQDRVWRTQFQTHADLYGQDKSIRANQQNLAAQLANRNYQMQYQTAARERAMQFQRHANIESQQLDSNLRNRYADNQVARQMASRVWEDEQSKKMMEWQYTEAQRREMEKIQNRIAWVQGPEGQASLHDWEQKQALSQLQAQMLGIEPFQKTAEEIPWFQGKPPGIPYDYNGGEWQNTMKDGYPYAERMGDSYQDGNRKENEPMQMGSGVYMMLDGKLQTLQEPFKIDGNKLMDTIRSNLQDDYERRKAEYNSAIEERATITNEANKEGGTLPGGRLPPLPEMPQPPTSDQIDAEYQRSYNTMRQAHDQMIDHYMGRSAQPAPGNLPQQSPEAAGLTGPIGPIAADPTYADERQQPGPGELQQRPDISFPQYQQPPEAAELASNMEEIGGPAAGDFEAQRKAAEDAMYKRAAERAKAGLKSPLEAQGGQVVPIGNITGNAPFEDNYTTRPGLLEKAVGPMPKAGLRSAPFSQERQRKQAAAVLKNKRKAMTELIGKERADEIPDEILERRDLKEIEALVEKQRQERKKSKPSTWQASKQKFTDLHDSIIDWLIQPAGD